MRTPTTPRRSWETIAFVLKAIAITALALEPTRSAAAQCQTWALEPQFDSSVVGGDEIDTCTVFNDGSGAKLWVGGFFGTTSGVLNVGRWDGHNWIPTSSLNSFVHSLTVYNDGLGHGDVMYAAGEFTVNATKGVARWDGYAWEGVAGGLAPWAGDVIATSLAEMDGASGHKLYVGGGFAGSSSVSSPGIICWDGVSWRSVGGGLGPLSYAHSFVTKLAVYDDGHGPALYVAGDFGSAGGQPISYLAKWDGTSWSALGTGINGAVAGMVVWNDGSGSKLYVSGVMTNAGGVPVSKMAIWDGTTWSAMANPPSTAAYAMVPFDDGSGPSLFAGLSTLVNGQYTHLISRFDGTNWSALGGGLHGDLCNGLAVYDDGSGHGPDLYVVGRFFNVGGGITSTHIARWMRCVDPIDLNCFGDLTLDACPCANTGQLGRGCDNSAVTGGALMKTAGATNPDTLRLIVSWELPNSLTILLQGSAPTLSVLPFGDGLRCTGGHLLRLYVAHATSGEVDLPGQGNPSISARSAALGDPLGPGSVRLYQVYYRDPFSTCGGFFNASNGARIVW